MKYKKNIILSMIFQGLSVSASFLLVPLTVSYLGVEEYGVWITLTNIIAWFSFFDIGLGHGLRNKYGESKAKGNLQDMRNYVSTTFFLLVLVALFILLIFGTLTFFLDWSLILNAPSVLNYELRNISLILIAMFCIRFVVSIINTLLTADQDPYIPMLINGLGGLLSLLSVYLVTKFTLPSILTLGVVLSVSQLFPLVCAFFYFFLTKYNFILPSLRFFSKTHINSIFSLGIRFFLIQLTALILFQGNNIIIAHVVGLKDVSEFNIAFKYINILYIVFSAFLSPLWSASTDAYTRGDISWVKRSIDKINYLWFFLIAVGVLQVILSPFLYRLWIKDAVFPDNVMLVMLLLYFVFLIKGSIYRSFMNGTGKISLQFYVTMIQSVLHVPFAVFLGKIYGVYGVIAVMILWVLINSLWERYQFKLIISDKAYGLWNR